MKPGKEVDFHKHVRSYDRIAEDKPNAGLEHFDNYDPDLDERDGADDNLTDGEHWRLRRQPRDGKDDPNLIYNPDVSR